MNTSSFRRDPSFENNDKKVFLLKPKIQSFARLARLYQKILTLY